MHSERRKEVSDISLSISNANGYLNGTRWSWMIYSSFSHWEGFIVIAVKGSVSDWARQMKVKGESRGVQPPVGFSGHEQLKRWNWNFWNLSLCLSCHTEGRYPSQRSWAAESSCSALFGQKIQVLHTNCSALSPQQSVLGKVGGYSFHSPLWSLFAEMNRSC